MGFFTVGNLLTLGIVLLVLVLYRSMDKRSRVLDKIRKYADKLKEDLASYVDEREGTVKNLGVELKVEEEAARELMNRIQAGNADLEEKAAVAERIDQRLNTYDASLEELVRMTSRVQENLNRIRDESAFVDGAYRRVSEAKTALEGLENSLESLEIRFEHDNAEALQKHSDEVIAAAKSAVQDLTAAAETIGRKVEEHRGEVTKIENVRAEALARDMEIVNKTLKTAVEQAALRADRMEEAALVKLKEQAWDRVEKIKTAEEDRIKIYQESARGRVAEIQNLVKVLKDDWKTEKQDWDAREKTAKEESKTNIQELKNLSAETRAAITAETAALEKRLSEHKAVFAETVSGHENLLKKTAEEMKQKALEITGAKLEEYREAQNEEFRHLEALAEDSKKLDAELRRYMQETVARVREEFTLFTSESARSRQKTAADFGAAADALKSEMAEVESGLSRLKETAYENVSEKLQGFEDEFLSGLEKRSADMQRRFAEWRDNFENRLSALGTEESEKRQKLEQDLTAEVRQALAARNERVLAELEKLKTETNAFEEGIREQMNAADISLAAYRDELERHFGEAGEVAETAIKAEIGKLNLSIADTIKLNQRDLEGKIRETAEYAENRNREIQELLDESRQHIIEQDGRIASVRAAMDDIHREADVRRDEIFARTDEQAKAIETKIREAERQIREFLEQTKLIEQADKLRFDLGRQIEDLKTDMDRLEQRRSEAAQLENQFIKVRRLEDEVNAKMTRFLSERHRIEQMDSEFNRLIQTSRAVDEKLKEVSASDDFLQQVQLQLRKISESLDETEEKYQRIEKKNQILETTNDGIDKNFRELQESEKTLKKVNLDLERITGDIESLRTSLEFLAGQNDKAKETTDQMIVLDSTLSGIEERISAMQAARDWIARAETRMDEINREILSNLKLVGEVKREKGKKPARAEDGPAPPLATREDVIKLKTRGWTVEEIAKSLKLSRSEVELILEISPLE